MAERGAGVWGRMAPALLLAFLAPMMTEVLPGATRFSSIFVFPVEMAVWGGGAVLIRGLVRKLGLGWWSLLLLGLALAVAEEMLVQQTSLAPLVIKLKGETWARAFGVNYIYLIWALVYEAVWVVLMPTLAVELIFPGRRKQTWLSRPGAIVTAVLFLIGCFFAWFSWTQIARTKVFHLPLYNPPLHWIGVAAVAIALLVFVAVKAPPEPPRGVWAPPRPWLLGLMGALWSVLWFGLVVLAFGIAPRLSEAAAVLGSLAIVALLLVFVPRWAKHPAWSQRHDFAVIAGSLTGSMAVSFFGFGAAPLDLWFKVIVDILACLWLVWLGRRVLRRN